MRDALAPYAMSVLDLAHTFCHSTGPRMRDGSTGQYTPCQYRTLHTRYVAVPAIAHWQCIARYAISVPDIAQCIARYATCSVSTGPHTMCQHWTLHAMPVPDIAYSLCGSTRHCAMHSTMSDIGTGHAVAGA
eukprot:3524851-Rhodomonas_salina.1